MKRYTKQEIISAIKGNKIIATLQKIRESDSQELNKCEVLARLKIDDSVLGPFEFLELAQEEGCYTLITRQIIDRTFPYMKENPEYKEFSINICMHDIHDLNLVEHLKEALQKTNLASRFIIELTEDFELTNPENIKTVQVFMQDFQQLGCKFALDDFGKGYATFDPLLNLEFDYIKFDGVLTKKLIENEKLFFTLEMLSKYATRLKIKTVAEFIEEEDEMLAMDEIGINYAQGYHIHKPDLIYI